MNKSHCPLAKANGVTVTCSPDCAWLIYPYTIEGNHVYDGVCAVVMIAMKAPAEYQV